MLPDEEEEIPISSRLSKLQKVKKPPSSKESAAFTNKVGNHYMPIRMLHSCSCSCGGFEDGWAWEMLFCNTADRHFVPPDW